MLKIKDNEFNKLVDYVKSNFGIMLINKRSLIEGRLSNLIQDRGFSSFGDYLESVYNDKAGNEITVLIDKLTTNHTYFMREPNHFEFYREKILPDVVKKSKDNDLRVWSAGCSSGQEPYSIAMINHDFFGDKKAFWDTSILATDISSKVLDNATKGVYCADDLEDLKSSWKNKYLIKKNDDNYEICDKIKKDIIFRNFNLMESVFPFKRKFHVIFCRNVMIYFDNATRSELVRKFYEYTEPGGYLFIGHSESINRDNSKFNYIMPAIYRKE